MIGRFSAGLCALEFRRATWRVLVPTALLLGLVLTLRAGPSAGLPFENAAAARGLFREEAWIATLVALIPLAVFRSACIPWLWRSGEAEWIAPRPIDRTTAVVSTWAGLALSLMLTLVGAGLWIESRVDGDSAAPVFLGSHPLPEVVRLQPGESRSLRVPTSALAPHLDAHEVRMRVRLTILPGGDPTSAVRLTAAGGARASEVLVDGRTWLELDCSLNGEALDCQLENLGAGQVGCLPVPGVELWRPAGVEHHAWIALATRAAIGLGCATTMAFAIATWIGSFTAAATVL
ncbi:MAG: hypothetical protein ACI80N_003831, partial [Gammaproteobacteria bacterium]